MAKSNDGSKEEAAKERKKPGVERLLRQFLKVDGPKGTTEEYKLGWVRNFGRATGEHSGTWLDTGDDGDEYMLCDDEYCWCRREE